MAIQDDLEPMGGADQGDVEQKHRYWVILNTTGTVINALGLAMGLWLVKADPDLAIGIVVGSIVFYAVIRMVAGYWFERKMPVYAGGAPNGNSGTDYEHPAGAPGKVDVTFPDKIVYEAQLIRVKGPGTRP